MEDSLTPTSDAKIANYTYACTSDPVTHLPLPGTYPYQILATDYTSYAVTWMCYQHGSDVDSHYEILWILTKHRNSMAALADKIAAISALAKLRPPLPAYQTYLGDVNQSGCLAEEEGIRIANETSTV